MTAGTPAAPGLPLPTVTGCALVVRLGRRGWLGAPLRARTGRTRARDVPVHRGSIQALPA